VGAQEKQGKSGMARNGPTGQTARAPARRHPPEEQFAPAQPAHPSWPPAHAYPEPQQGYGQQQGQGFHFPQTGDGDPNYGFSQQAGAQPPTFTGYAPHQAPAYAPAYAPPQQAQAWEPEDPRGFDLGNYMPAQQGYPPGSQQSHAALPPHGAAHGPPQDAGHFGPQQDYGEGEAEYDETLSEDEEEPRRGRRGVMITAALIGAIAFGGAMAYTYKAFFGSGGGRAPLIRLTDSGPSKIKPDDPGGREFAHTDKKLLNRLSEPGAASSEPETQEDRSGDDANVPRKVRVIPIPPSGQQGAAPVVTTSSVTARPTVAPVTVNVPGVMLENLTPPPAQQAQPPLAGRPPAAPPVKVVSAAQASDPVASDVAPVARKAAVVAPKAQVTKVKQAAAPAVTSPSGSSGFVAVLASKKSRMDALKAFADLQQKYAEVLAAKTPDVQEADLGDKGVWYRAVVGPPGSREAANGVCSQLKTAGHAGCWVAAY
jgi:hypothetical protein